MPYAVYDPKTESYFRGVHANGKPRWTRVLDEATLFNFRHAALNLVAEELEVEIFDRFELREVAQTLRGLGVFKREGGIKDGLDPLPEAYRIKFANPEE
jgi:hypothetical protein